MLEIAVCDDEPVMRKELFAHFSSYMAKKQDMDYRISSFENGNQLLESGCEFDLIFLDIQMEWRRQEGLDGGGSAVIWFL